MHTFVPKEELSVEVGDINDVHIHNMNMTKTWQSLKKNELFLEKLQNIGLVWRK